MHGAKSNSNDAAHLNILDIPSSTLHRLKIAAASEGCAR